MTKTLNNKGMTLIELMISIMVASMIISMLLSLLTMSLKAKATLDVENKMAMESTLIAEKLRWNMFELQAQEIELITDDANETVINITHTHDIILDGNEIIAIDTSNPITHVLRYDKTTFQITYDSGSGPILMHDINVLIDVGSSIELISIDDTVCDLAIEACEQGVIQLTLTITVVFPNGAVLVPKTYVTTIIM